ncbi:MAG: type II toxin-antitoxin system VapC family toxin [Proteobacteria bacterium]|nr:type II toxin-antitoxin system VapC family toxin [Pseudomonadota bacterium]
MVILDTHAWFQWIVTPELLPERVQSWLKAADLLAISAISPYEIALHVERGRVQIHLPLRDWFAEAIAGSGIELLPVTPNIAASAAALPQIHRDPWDRIIIATALEYDVVLLTKDATIPLYPGVKAVWRHLS